MSAARIAANLRGTFFSGLSVTYRISRNAWGNISTVAAAGGAPSTNLAHHSAQFLALFARALVGPLLLRPGNGQLARAPFDP
jgi:hypothetical protein